MASDGVVCSESAVLPVVGCGVLRHVALSYASANSVTLCEVTNAGAWHRTCSVERRASERTTGGPVLLTQKIEQAAEDVWNSVIGLEIARRQCGSAMATDTLSTAIGVAGAQRACLVVDCSVNLARTIASIMFSADERFLSRIDAVAALERLALMMATSVNVALSSDGHSCHVAYGPSTPPGFGRVVAALEFESNGESLRVSLVEPA